MIAEEPAAGKDSASHRLPVRVYYEDTDAGGVVYYANYLRYAERARTEMLRERGIDLAEWMQRGVVFVVRETTLDLRRPARYGELLVIETVIVELKAVSLALRHRVLRGEDVLVENAVVLCAVGADLKPKRIPPEIAGRLDRTHATLPPTGV